MDRRTLLLLVVTVISVACQRPSVALPMTTPATGAETPSALAEPGPTATGQPHATAAGVSALAPSLGEPKRLGRGRIVEACFSPDARLLVVGWSHAVLLWSAETGVECW